MGLHLWFLFQLYFLMQFYIYISNRILQFLFYLFAQWYVIYSNTILHFLFYLFAQWYVIFIHMTYHVLHLPTITEIISLNNNLDTSNCIFFQPLINLSTTFFISCTQEISSVILFIKWFSNKNYLKTFLPLKWVHFSKPETCSSYILKIIERDIR